MFPTPAPESPSTTRRTQYGAASAAIHAPPPASAPDELGSAVLASDQRALALRPSSILLASLQHLRFPADHAPAAAHPSLPVTALPADLPPLPQTHCASHHAAPRAHPDSASAQRHRPRLAGKALWGDCRHWSQERAPESAKAVAGNMRLGHIYDP